MPIQARALARQHRMPPLYSSFDVCRTAEVELAMNQAIVLESLLTCPACGREELETMPTNACQYFYECKGCGALLRPEAGDCCVFCSYGSVPCPPIQQGRQECCD